MVHDLPLVRIFRRADARPIDESAVCALADSIGAVGIINPLRVRAKGDGWEVVAGSHRLAACERLGLVDVPCSVVVEDDLHAELAMIDENLCRAELFPSDRARQTARRKAIYEELHPEVKQGGAPGLPGGGKAKVDNLSSFADATADATGRDARSVRRDAERGEKVIDEVLDMLRGTRLDTGAYLDKIKRLPPNDQVTAARRDLALERQRDRVKPPKEISLSAASVKEQSDEPLSRKDRRGLELTIREAHFRAKALQSELQDMRLENAKLRDERDTLRHELEMLKKRFDVQASSSLPRTARDRA